MKKFLKALFILFLVSLLIVAGYVLVTFPPVMRGMAAKTMCSCVFVSGRSPQSVIDKELQVFPGLAELDIKIDSVDSTVNAALLWSESKAIYRKGLGCTLLAEASEEEVRAQKFSISTRTLPDQDTIPWPMGDMDAFTREHAIDQAALDNAVFEAFEEKDPARPIHTHAIVVVYNGKIVAEKYADGFNEASVMTGWSMTKSITNALIGILVKEGKLALGQPAPVAEWEGDERRTITVNHLLQASSGLRWSESYFHPAADFHNMFIRSDDKAAYALNRDLVHAPGEHFQYSSGTTNILSRIIRQTVGERDYHSFPREKLFARIGMQSALIEADASGTFVCSSYGHATARDWARLGLLYLNGGVWEGERILPEGWVEYSTKPAPAATLQEYGAQIWLNRGSREDPGNVKFSGLPNESIVFSGFEDNFVVIIPSRNLVVVRLGVTHNDGFRLDSLINGIINALPREDNLAR